MSLLVPTRSIVSWDRIFRKGKGWTCLPAASGRLVHCHQYHPVPPGGAAWFHTVVGLDHTPQWSTITETQTHDGKSSSPKRRPFPLHHKWKRLFYVPYLGIRGREMSKACVFSIYVTIGRGNGSEYQLQVVTVVGNSNLSLDLSIFSNHKYFNFFLTLWCWSSIFWLARKASKLQVWTRYLTCNCFSTIQYSLSSQSCPGQLWCQETPGEMVVRENVHIGP